jgi:hypothetical protein
MARYKEYSYDQGKLIPILFHEQSGTRKDFERRRKKLEYQVRFLLRKHRLSCNQ